MIRSFDSLKFFVLYMGIALVVIGLIVAFVICFLYTSDAADERSSVDLGGRRIIKKKKKQQRSTRIKQTHQHIHELKP